MRGPLRVPAKTPTSDLSYHRLRVIQQRDKVGNEFREMRGYRIHAPIRNSTKSKDGSFPMRPLFMTKGVFQIWQNDLKYRLMVDVGENIQSSRRALSQRPLILRILAKLGLFDLSIAQLIIITVIFLSGITVCLSIWL